MPALDGGADWWGLGMTCWVAGLLDAVCLILMRQGSVQQWEALSGCPLKVPSRVTCNLFHQPIEGLEFIQKWSFRCENHLSSGRIWAVHILRQAHARGGAS